MNSFPDAYRAHTLGLLPQGERWPKAVCGPINGPIGDAKNLTGQGEMWLAGLGRLLRGRRSWVEFLKNKEATEGPDHLKTHDRSQILGI